MAPVERVILFGSRARGDHDEDSDWDLCVLLSDDIPAGVYTPASMSQAVRDLGLAVQVVPMRTSVFDDTRSDVNALAHDVARDGIVLFDESSGPRP
jgi:2-keto-4-pentenoate hydratase